MYQGYDLIGDIHGCGKTLEVLLKQLGYSKQKGVYAHPQRKVVFIGDIVDRGPNIRLACQIVYDMVQAGHAHIVMGNHEYNLITYCTKAPKGFKHSHLREHSKRNTFVVEQTLEQYANYPHDFKQMLEWFVEIPLFMEFDHFRAVHACWDQNMIKQYIAQYGGNQLTSDMLFESVDTESFLYQFLDRSLRGTSLKLPNKQVVESKDGMRRRFFRTKFWYKNPKTYGDVVFQPDPLPKELDTRLLSEKEKKQILYYPKEEKILFLGHYWMSGIPTPITPNIACIDYSAVKYGRLAAYRMNTEKKLHRARFTWVRVERDEQ